jgi:transcriptional regulator with XRE-family HTH domain
MGIRGDRVKKLREMLNLEQYEAAFRMGISQAHLSRIEGGQIRSVGSDKLAKVVQILNTNIEYIIGVSDDPTPREMSDAMSEDTSNLLYAYKSIQSVYLRQAIVDMVRRFLTADLEMRGIPVAEEPIEEAPEQ